MFEEKEGRLCRLGQKYFKGKGSINRKDLLSAFDRVKNGNRRDKDASDDKYKLGLLVVLIFVLLATEENVALEWWWFELVDDLDAFNMYPWGNLSYSCTVNLFRRNLSGLFTKHEDKVQYTSYGLLHAVLAWAMESIPSLQKLGRLVDETALPRMLKWEVTRRVSAAKVVAIFEDKEVQVFATIVASDEEKEKPYYIELIDDFEIPMFDKPVEDENVEQPSSATPPPKASTGLDYEKVKDEAVKVLEEENKKLYSQLEALQKKVDLLEANSKKAVCCSKCNTVMNIDMVGVEEVGEQSEGKEKDESEGMEKEGEKVGEQSQGEEKDESEGKEKEGEKVGEQSKGEEKEGDKVEEQFEDHEPEILEGHEPEDHVHEMDVGEEKEQPVTDKVGEKQNPKDKGKDIIDDNVGVGNKKVVDDVGNVVEVVDDGVVGDEKVAGKKKAQCEPYPYNQNVKRRKVDNVCAFDPYGELDPVLMQELQIFLDKCDDSKVVRVVDEDVEAKQLKSIVAGGWLGTPIINAAFAGVRRRQTAHRGLYEQDARILDTYFLCELKEMHSKRDNDTTVENLVFGKKFINYVNGVVPTDGKPWEGCKCLYIPVNENSHWFLVKVDLGMRKIYVYDSLGNHVKRAQLIKWIVPLQLLIPHLMRKHVVGFEKYGLKKLEVEKVECPLQQNGSDCGIFTIKFLEFLLGRLDVKTIQNDHMPMWRKKLVAELICMPF